MKQFAHYIKSFLLKLVRLSIYVSCAALTIFVLASSYETAFGQSLPLPYVHAVSKVNLSFIRPDPVKFVSRLNKQTNSYFEGNYGPPLQLKLAGTDIPIPIAEPIYHDQNWLARSSTAHYIILSPSKTGYIGDLIVYMVSSKTTLSDLTKIGPNTNIFLDTKRDWRYFYRVDEVDRSISSSDSFILPASNASRLFIVIDRATSHDIIVASLTNVQNADQ